MARPRKHAPPDAVLPPLPSSTFPFQLAEDDTEHAAAEKNGDGPPPSPFLLHRHHHHHHHHLHHHRLQHAPAFVKSSARLSVLLIMAALGAFFLLFFLFPPSTPQDELYYTKDGESHDFTLGGLLTKESDTSKCQSRGIIHRLRVKSFYIPSPYLVSKLREYEALHRRCGSGTERFNKSMIDLELGMLKDRNAEVDGECKYVVWVANSGLGNRLMSIAAAFVYALLTRRVLLLDGRSDLRELLCEPFPGEISWFLPPEFTPLSSVSHNLSSPHRFGLHLRQGSRFLSVRQPPKEDQKKLSPAFAASQPSPLFSYIHLAHDYDFFDKLFFCDAEQASLNEIPWLFLRSNLYFVPSLYLYIPSFHQELNRLFPDSEAIFHHISRYLFFPTNSVWSWMMRHYNAYLARSSQIVGVQIRSFVFPPVMHPHITKQIVRCGEENNLLPKISKAQTHGESFPMPRNLTSILITSLLPDYSQQLKELYADQFTQTGEIVSVHQPSHELHQNTQSRGHNLKAWAEMCLLSFSNKLITSPVSTFGYVAQGLAGIKPWILIAAENGNSSSSACSQALSIEPCFHAPPYYNCDGNKGDDTSKVLTYIKHCEDLAWGLKVFPRTKL